MKYYYTDPISARYMAERFGIKYRVASEDTVEIAGDGFYVSGKILINGYKLYVAEEQHHLFKAQAGDIIAFPPCDYDGEIYCQQVFKHPDGGVCIWSDQLRYHSIESDYQIIMRDGKHFFMPEVE